MPSSYTPQLRLEQQFTGENINVWGTLLNAVLSRLDTSIAGLKTIALTGNYTLTVANGTDDEARAGIIKTTGTGTFTITIPSVSKIYLIWNTCTGVVTVTTGAGTTAAVASGEALFVFCDGSNVKRVFSQDMGGSRLTSVGTPTATTDAATKAYVDALKTYVDNTAWSYNAGNLPGQTGNAGKVLSTNGTVAAWTSSLPSLNLSTSDGSTALLVNGSSKGLRVVPGSGAIVVEGTDNAGSTYQPLVLGGSSVSISLSGGAAQTVATTSLAIAFAAAL